MITKSFHAQSAACAITACIACVTLWSPGSDRPAPGNQQAQAVAENDLRESLPLTPPQLCGPKPSKQLEKRPNAVEHPGSSQTNQPIPGQIQLVTYTSPLPPMNEPRGAGRTAPGHRNAVGSSPTQHSPINQLQPTGRLARYPLNQQPKPEQFTNPDADTTPDVGVTKLFRSQAFADTVAKIPTSQPASSPDPLSQLSAEDRATLRDLPPMCTSDLSGLDLSSVTPARDRLPAETVAQASASMPATSTTGPLPAASSFPTPSARPARGAGSMPNPHSSINMKADLSEYRIARAAAGKDPNSDPHLEIYSRSAFPSARDCATCHKQLYEEWAGSSHAYASISPMFHKFEDKINRLAQGTLGYFCLRCHAPVATTMGLRRDQPIWDGPEVFREGVTCVACHRVKIPYTKSNGERRIEPGGLNDPVYGASDGSGGAIAHKYKDFFKVTTDPNEKKQGQLMHRRAIQFEELNESTFCMSCHQVAVQPGIKLEVVWDQYRASPAYREGVSCQDCHMGTVPGVDGGYSVGPAAVVNDKVVNAERKHSNHTFYGPGYSIAHPGIFPHNLKNTRWTVNDWLQFDWRGGWGTEQFEKAIDEGHFHTTFPPVWAESDDRMDAREIVDENLEKLEYKKDLRRQVLENGSKLDGPFFFERPTVGQPLKFRYCLTNTNPGHNMPSGSLGAQPQLWMNVVLISPSGNRIWETGYVDSNGDLADNHSLDVAARKVPFDTQLFNLQTKFLTTNVKGTDREMYLPINVDIDQLPFLRPPAQPISVLNHPPFIRMEGHSIPALGSRNAKFAVPSRLMHEPGIYRMSVRMRSRAEPIYFMRFCEATPEMERMMNEWIADFHVQTVTFEVR